MRAFLALICSVLACQAEVIRDVAYVADGDPLQKLDLYLPEKRGEKPLPVLIAIHGGGWYFGDKTNAGFVQPKVQWFNDQGFIVASINYRLTPAVTHPGHIKDVCAAVAWIEGNIAKHGGDPKRLVLLGHSAGAHLAALAGVDEARLADAGADLKSIRGVILLDGAAYNAVKQIADTLGKRRDNLYTRAFTHDLITQQDASPTLKVDKMKATPPPFLILYVAQRDESKQQSNELAAALKAKGGKTQVLGIEGKTHGTINRDLGTLGDATTEAVAAFLKTLD